MSLRTRLLISYLAILAVFMCIIGLVLVLLMSEVQRNVVFQQLNSVANTSTAILLLTQRTPVQLQERIADSQDVRILLVGPAGQVLRDSEKEVSRWNLLQEADYQERPDGLQGTWEDEGGQTWLFVGRPVVLRQDATPSRREWIIFTVTEPDRREWFREHLARPLILAGGIGLALSALLAWVISRSVARPLQQVAGAAHAIAQGDYDQTVPLSGPSEVRHLAQDFNTMAQQVQASRDAQRDFVANVSHELKTPLTSIQGYSQAILDGTADDPQSVERSAAIIHDEAERMRRMVAELLDLARIESGQIVMRREPVDLGALLNNLAERFRLPADEAGVVMKAQIAQLSQVMGDGDRLAQVFTNLLDNALKHTPQGGQVTLAAKLATPSGVRRFGKKWPAAVEVSVSDSGQGIPPEDLPRVFERFYQVDKSRVRTGSVGLGLAITREIVEAHGGSIKAESIVELGTRFTVMLPVGTLEGN